jgi:excisionase family DNA binding protein
LFDNYPDVVTVKEMQTMLRIGRSTAYKLIGDGVIPSVRIGTSYLITKKSIENFLSAGS